MKRKIIWGILAAVAVVVCIAAIWGYWNHVHWMDPSRAEKAAVRGQCQPFCELNAEETEKAVRLYNAAQYDGKADGSGGTPYVNVRIYYEDGSYFWISDFGRSMAEVTFHNANGERKSWFYVRSQELIDFLFELEDKYCASKAMYAKCFAYTKHPHGLARGGVRTIYFYDFHLFCSVSAKRSHSLEIPRSRKSF